MNKKENENSPVISAFSGIGTNMEQIFRVSFFGHRILYDSNDVEKKLVHVCSDIICSNSNIEFYIGRNGEFDIVAASVIKRLQKKFDENNCQLFLVLPYATKDIEDYAAYYDAIIIPDSISHCYPKRAITFRNQWMVDCSDLIVCYVDHKSGGAYHAVHYAETQKKQIVNIHNKGFLPIYKKTGEFYES